MLRASNGRFPPPFGAATERYLVRPDLHDAPCDHLKLDLTAVEGGLFHFVSCLCKHPKFTTGRIVSHSDTIRSC